MRGDSDRDHGDRSAVNLVQRRQVDGWAVKADTPAENGDDEGDAYDAPGPAVGALYCGRRHSTTNSRRVSNPSRRYNETAAPLSGRT